MVVLNLNILIIFSPRYMCYEFYVVTVLEVIWFLFSRRDFVCDVIAHYFILGTRVGWKLHRLAMKE